MHWVLNYWTYLLVELLNISFERSFNIRKLHIPFRSRCGFFPPFSRTFKDPCFFTWDVRLPPQGAQTSLLAAGVDRKASWHGRRSFLGSRNRCVYWLYPTPSMQSSPPGLYIIVYKFSREIPIPDETFIWRLESWVEGRSNAYSYWCVDLYSRSHAVNMPWK